jgi:G3E family GTPase
MAASALPPPLPVTVLTGFLGAGKTTLLRRLLAAPHGRRIGVVLNEIGQTGIDDLDAAKQRELIELSEGCVCCTRSPDLVRALHDMHARGDVDLVIVETTGLADPLALTWILANPDLAEVARLDAVITVLDPLNLDRAASDEWSSQVRCGDLLVVTKLDLVPAADVPATLSRVQAAAAAAGSGARLIDARADLPVAMLLDVTPDAAAAAARAAAPAHAHHSGYQVVSLADRATYRAGPLEDLVETLPEAVFRAKGILKVERGWAAFHAVGGRIDFLPDAPAPAHGESRVVFIGPSLDEPALAAALHACRAGA